MFIVKNGHVRAVRSPFAGNETHRLLQEVSLRVPNFVLDADRKEFIGTERLAASYT
jgi:hypothetical protein